jgi:hypothetical protein
MATSSTTKRTKKSVKVKNLPAKAKTLTAKQAKKVKGGFVGDVHQPEAIMEKMDGGLNIAGHETNIVIKQK